MRLRYIIRMGGWSRHTTLVGGTSTNNKKSHSNNLLDNPADPTTVHVSGVVKSSDSGTNFLVPKVNLAPQDWFLEIYC